MEDRRKNTLFVLILNTVIAVLFLSGQYYTSAIGVSRAAIIVIIALFLTVFLPALSFYWQGMNRVSGRAREKLTQTCAWLREHPKLLIKGILLYAAVFAAAFVITAVYSKSQNRSFIDPLFHMCAALLSLPVTIYLLRNKLGTKPELLFAALIMTAGIFFINASPVELGITWDDEAHYERSLSISYLPSGIIYAADDDLFVMQPEAALEKFGYSEEDRTAHTQKLNQLYRDRVLVPYRYKGMGNYAILSYLPFAFGITMGRGLHIPFTWVFRLGKLVNLMTYAAMIYYAMSRLKFGKILAGCIGLLPTVTYMASLYSYDPYVAGMMIVGFAVFFSYLQNPHSKMTNADIAIICISFLLGCLPKAVYCVIMLPLLFMPADRFVSKKQHFMYIFCGCLTVAFLCSTFLLPRLLHGMGTGDQRGRTDVNATEQMAYVMENPVRFMKILWHFYTTVYLTPTGMLMFMENYAYLGVNLHNWMTPLVLLATAILDRNGTRSKTSLISISSIIGVILGVLVVAFTFYISFTPVGYDTVVGCQSRYLIPMVFPFLYIVCSDRIRNPLPKGIFNTVPMMWMTLSFIIYTGTELIQMF